MSQVFLSHATKDDDTVTRIHDELEASTGRKVWVDHKDIDEGDNWQEAIDAALRDCPYCVVVISRHSVKSGEVTAEWRAAMLYKHRLLLAIIDDVPLEDISSRLRILSMINLHADWDGGMARLAAAIKGAGDGALDAAPDGDFKAAWPVVGRIEPKLVQIPISGRDDDLKTIQTKLKRGPTSVVGVGGLGKSRLAAELVMTGEGIGGAVWHTASDISRPDEVLELLRDHFGLEATTERKETLARLKTHKRLVVIDNAESVPDARRGEYVTLVNDLHEAGAQVLLTSRNEWEEGDWWGSHRPPELTLDAAKQVVLDMQAAFDTPDLSADAESLAREARQHPRLIEWAVRQTKRFPADKVIGDLRSLTSKEVQKALDEMILKTLRQMTEAEGEAPAWALKRLAVCRGGFTYEAAKAILMPFSNPLPDPPPPAGEGEAVPPIMDADVMDAALAALQTWQFVTFDGQRYAIDPLVIAAVGADEPAHRPHHDYYYALARKHDEKQDYLGLDVESANLEAAFEWAMRAGNYAAALDMATACGHFLSNRGRFEQRLDWSKKVLEAVVSHHVAKPDVYLMTSMLFSLIQAVIGQAYSPGDRVNELRWVIDTCSTLSNYFTSSGEHKAFAAIQITIGISYYKISQVEAPETNLQQAIEAYKAALQYYAPQDMPREYASTQNNLGNAYGDLARIKAPRDNLLQAIAAYESALKYHDPQRAPLDYAATQHNLGATYHDLAQIEDKQGNLRQAIEGYKAALVYYTAQAAPLNFAHTQRQLGIVQEEIGDLPAAITCWREAETYYRQMGYVEDADLMRRWIEEAEGKAGSA